MYSYIDSRNVSLGQDESHLAPACRCSMMTCQSGGSLASQKSGLRPLAKPRRTCPIFCSRTSTLMSPSTATGSLRSMSLRILTGAQCISQDTCDQSSMLFSLQTILALLHAVHRNTVSCREKFDTFIRSAHHNARASIIPCCYCSLVNVVSVISWRCSLCQDAMQQCLYQSPYIGELMCASSGDILPGQLILHHTSRITAAVSH